MIDVIKSFKVNIGKCFVGSQIKKWSLTARLKCIAPVICREESYGCFYFIV